MQTLIDIEENQLNKLLFYTRAKNGTEAILIDMQKKRLLQNIQNRFSSIPKEISLVDELIAERRFEALQELE